MQYVPTWPAISARIDDSGSGVVTLNDTEHQIKAESAEDARREVVRFCAESAQKLQRPVRVTVEEPDATWPLIVHPDGKVDTADETVSTDETSGLEAVVGSAPGSVIDAVPGVLPHAEPGDSSTGPRRTSHVPVIDEYAAAAAPAPSDGAKGGTDAEAGRPADTTDGTAGAAVPAVPAEPTPLPLGQPAPPEPGLPGARPISPHGRTSFIQSETAEDPATRGWRGFLVRAGVKVGPGAVERNEREDRVTVAQQWTGPRTIAVVNGKGGANKTPTTILTAAMFARHGGAGVLAWDNNQTRGTLGWRTEQGPHDATLHDLLPETERLLSSDAQSAELARFVHHQSRDHYDVLRSQPMALASQQRVSSGDVDRVHSVAAKYYRLIVMDSGNDESDPMWLRMIDHTDQLVVATSSRAEHAEAGALLLEALADRDERSAALARNAVAVVSQSDEKTTPSEIRRIEQGYADLVRDVVRIPFDPAMGASQLHVRALNPTTQRAWLAASAAIARGLPLTPPSA
ncbi:MinD/ParA family ATP-binding protein [Microbacterium halotolerans]|uniref:MinD/ParA family ATP-binding protein n=1 Tax=Microbacterium halotolerans TaxID=246613 RepID=UPI000E6AC384|nr:ATPase [Microbacterium halotolerans]